MRPPSVIDAFSMPIGVQICSDLNRPEGCHLLGAGGAHAVVAPRATEAATYDRWRLVIRANAITSGLYVLSVNRPGPEGEVGIGGPSIAVDPNGSVLLETTDPIGMVTLDPGTIEAAARSYPGYLPVRADLYAEAWSSSARTATRLPSRALDEDR